MCSDAVRKRHELLAQTDRFSTQVPCSKALGPTLSEVSRTTLKAGCVQLKQTHRGSHRQDSL